MGLSVGDMSKLLVSPFNNGESNGKWKMKWKLLYIGLCGGLLGF